MRLVIRHLTAYDYDSPISGATQVLRLTPRSCARQRVLSWRVSAPGSTRAWVDAHGNRAETLAVTRPLERVEILAEGEVETLGAASSDAPALPASAYLRPTALTGCNEAVRALARASSGDPDRLLASVRGAVAYVPGTSSVETTAAQALARGAGVCQDHAHLLLACCRHLGIPARYVSGYLQTRDGVASHAWAEALTPAGWIGFDPANGGRAGESHVVLAYGMDYLDAAPVRGSRQGGGAERMSVDVAVIQAQQ
jgi:transglutaminase-like putative cysteine protease